MVQNKIITGTKNITTLISIHIANFTETKLKLLEHFIVDSSLADPQVVTGSLCFVTLRLFFPDISLFIFDAVYPPHETLCKWWLWCVLKFGFACICVYVWEGVYVVCAFGIYMQGRSHLYGWYGFNRTTFRGNTTTFLPI